MKKIKKFANHNSYLQDTKIYKKYVSYCKSDKHLHYDIPKLQYVENQTNAYIDTGIIPNAETGIYLDFTWTDSPQSDTYSIGLRNDTGNTRWCIGVNPNRVYYGYGNWSGPVVFPVPGNRYQVKLNFYNDKKFVVNNDKDMNEVLNLPTLSFIPTYNIRIFGSAGVQASYSTSKVQIHRVKITQGDTLIMDLIPTKRNDLGCMFDIINNVMYYPNRGTLITGPKL